MARADQRGGENRVLPLEDRDDEGQLPFQVEQWATDDDRVERLIGRATSLVLARAIYGAAVTEHPGRRIVLRRGGRILQDSAGAPK